MYTLKKSKGRDPQWKWNLRKGFNGNTFVFECDGMIVTFKSEKEFITTEDIRRACLAIIEELESKREDLNRN